LSSKPLEPVPTLLPTELASELLTTKPPVPSLPPFVLPSGGASPLPSGEYLSPSDFSESTVRIQRHSVLGSAQPLTTPLPGPALFESTVPTPERIEPLPPASKQPSPPASGEPPSSTPLSSSGMILKLHLANFLNFQ
jgi:hypothetical protein